MGFSYRFIDKYDRSLATEKYREIVREMIKATDKKEIVIDFETAEEANEFRAFLYDIAKTSPVRHVHNKLSIDLPLELKNIFNYDLV